MATQVSPAPRSSSPAHHKTDTTREQCVHFLEKGKSIEELTETCKELLGANSKVGLLARRNSAVGRIWSAYEGHNSRSYAEPGFGSATDIVASDKEKSMGEIFIESKTPEEREKIKKTIARTASRGAKIRTDDIITEQDIQHERQEEQLKRRSSRERQKSALY